MGTEIQQRRNYDVAGFGITAVDDIVQLGKFPEPDSKYPIELLERHAGGQCGSALVAAARQGAQCVYAGILGRNELSDYVRASLHRERIKIAAQIRYNEAKPYYSIILLDGSTGDRTILYSPDGVRGPEADDISESLISESRAIVVDQLGPGGTLQACKLARKWGTKIIADFERIDDDRLHEAMQYIDHLIIPLRLARQLTGCTEPRDALCGLANPGRACTAVTDGSRGCWFRKEHEAVQHQPSFRVDVVDTTGCGDVFHGAYAAVIASGMPPKKAIEYAAAVAALSATQRGGQTAIPDRNAVEGFLTCHATDRFTNSS